MTALEVTGAGRSAFRRRPARPGSLTGASGLGLGVALLWFSLLVLIPLAAVVATAATGGWAGFWAVLTNSQTAAALQLSEGDPVHEEARDDVRAGESRQAVADLDFSVLEESRS